MSVDSHKNFSYSTVATAPSPASSGTTLIVASGDGSKFPATPFNATVWPSGSQPSTANAEIVRVTNISTDTLTITRAQESSSARSITSGDQIAATITAKTLTDVESAAGATMNTVAASGASQTVSYATAPLWDITLTAACTLTLSSVTSGYPTYLTLVLRQDGTGSRTVTWPASVNWLGGYVPVLQTAASSVDVVSLFTVDGGTTWYGFAASELTLDWKQAISGTSTYASASTFTCSGDQTGVFKIGKKLRITQSSTLKYFVIVGSTYNGTTTTTVTITGGSDYSLANASLDQVLISTLDFPDGWPGAFNWSPTVSGITGAATLTCARFSVQGRICTLYFDISGTSNATSFSFTLPITARSQNGSYGLSAGIQVVDSGASQLDPGRIVISAGASSATLNKTITGNAWTASGTKEVLGQVIYEF